MNTTTTGQDMSSTGPDQVDEQEAAAKRVSLLRRAIERVKQETDHIEQTERVVKPVLSEFVAHNSLGEVAELFVLLAEATARLDDANKAVQNMMSFTREVTLPERMDNEQTTSFKDLTGNQVIRTTRLFASIVAGKTDEAFDWLRKNDYGSLIKETVNSSSLSSAAKELIETGHELPDDTFAIHMKNGVSIRKAKAKGK